MPKNYWILKSEPDCYSIDDLKRDKKTHWDGVRNFQARNFLRDNMKVGDLCIFYHSSTTPPHAAGIAEIVREGYADPTQFDPKSDHPDLESDPRNPRWFVVDIAFRKKFSQPVSVESIKKNPKLLGMQLLKRGNRLSVFPVSQQEFLEVERMGS